MIMVLSIYIYIWFCYYIYIYIYIYDYGFVYIYIWFCYYIYIYIHSHKLIFMYMCIYIYMRIYPLDETQQLRTPPDLLRPSGKRLGHGTAGEISQHITSGGCPQLLPKGFTQGKKPGHHLA